VACEQPTNVKHHRIPYSFFKRGKVRGNPNRASNCAPLCSPPMPGSCHETYDNTVGQMPYMGTDRTKNLALALNVEALLALDARFVKALPGYALRVHAEWKRGQKRENE
jgi:hypothetical protein